MTTPAIARSVPDPPAEGGSRVALAYGDPDDHLQMMASLASQLAPKSERAAPCWDPRTTWSARMAAFREVAFDAKQPVAIFDPDALDVVPSEAERWEDAFFLRQRREFLTEIVEIGRRLGWVFLRPRPSAGLTEYLRGRGVRHELPVGTNVDRPLDEHLLLNGLAPEVRDMAVALMELGALEGSTLRRILADDEESRDGITASQVIANLAYDALPSVARRQARDLAVIRRPEHVNGSVGPFAWADAQRGSAETVVDRASYDLLIKRGILRAHGSPRGPLIRISRDMRTLLQRQAGVIDPDRHRDMHQRMARYDAKSMDERTEQHYHAVRAGDVDLAIEDPPYATDLRALAYQWSHEEQYAKAASLYRIIVDKFDAEDAYAWEYYAWNLAKQHMSSTRAMGQSDEIAKAYERAHELESDNPLFHGRWLGFRAELGQDVVDEFIRGLERYTEAGYGGSLPWFAEPVIRGWRRSHRAADEKRAVDRVRFTLLKYPRLRDLLGEKG